VWGLPFLTVLAPSKRYTTELSRRHKTIVDWARQMILQLARWLPEWQLIVLMDLSYTGQKLLGAIRGHVTVVAQMRLDSRLHAPPPPRRPRQRGGIRKVGERLPSLKDRLADPLTGWICLRVSGWYSEREVDLQIATGTALWYYPGNPAIPIRWVIVRDPAGRREPRAYLSTDPAMDALEIIRLYVRRWCVEVTFEETRRHLGIETQRQWSALAIARTTPCLLGLFSIVVLLADRLQQLKLLQVRSAAWYPKTVPTFSDAIAAVRRQLWVNRNLLQSRSGADPYTIPEPLLCRLVDALAYAA